MSCNDDYSITSTVQAFPLRAGTSVDRADGARIRHGPKTDEIAADVRRRPPLDQAPADQQGNRDVVRAATHHHGTRTPPAPGRPKQRVEVRIRRRPDDGDLLGSGDE